MQINKPKTVTHRNNGLYSLYLCSFDQRNTAIRIYLLGKQPIAIPMPTWYNIFTKEVKSWQSTAGGDVLEIVYRNKKLEKVCTNAHEAEKSYSPQMAEKIHMRIDEITAADTVEMLVQFHIGRCHALHGDRKGQYAMDLVHPYRLIFEKRGDLIQVALIVEIVDYH